MRRIVASQAGGTFRVCRAEPKFNNFALLQEFGGGYLGLERHHEDVGFGFLGSNVELRGGHQGSPMLH